jgi:micrococcal nuclease
MIALIAAVALLCSVTDGDTLRCNGHGVRLLGIDAPELPGHCRTGRYCAPGDPYASKRSLQTIISGRSITIHPVTTDRYGRMVAKVVAGRQDLSCYQLRTRHAIYVRKWDNGGRIAATCSAWAR